MSNLLPVNNLPRAIAYPHPFRLEERQLIRMRPGQTLQQLLEEVQPNPHLRPAVFITINGIPVSPDLWPSTVPAPDSIIVVKILPQGGIAKIFVAIAAILAAVIVQVLVPGPWGMFLGALAGMAVGVVGNLLVNALIPPARAAALTPFGNQPQDSPTQFVSGAKNQLNKWGTVPFLLGYHRIVPVKMAEDVSEAQGQHQYVRCLFGQYGPMEVSQLKIGQTAVSNFQEMEAEFRNLTYIDPNEVSTVYGDEAATLFTNDIHEEALSILLEQNVANIRTTQAGIREISVDVTLQACFSVDNNGNKLAKSVLFKVECRESPVGTWELVVPVTPAIDDPAPSGGQLVAPLNIRFETIGYPWGTPGSSESDASGNWRITASTTSALRRGLRWAVNPTGDPGKSYDVRITRLTGPDDTKSQSVSYWTALRSIKPGAPILFPGTLAKIGVRIQASEQLNGTLDEFNFKGRSILPDWDAGTETWITRPTHNPASCFRAVVQSQGSPNPLADSRLDLVQIQYWHEYCTAQGWAYNRNVDQVQDWRGLLDEIAAAGRAAFSDYNGKISVILDEPQPGRGIPLNPRVVKDVEVQITYPDLPHAFRCPFKNEAMDWQDDERVVLDDGWAQLDNAGNLVDAWGNSATQSLDAAAVVDVGGGVAGIPCTGHGLQSGWSITQAGTTNYNGAYTVLGSSTPDQINIKAAYVPETLGGGATVSLAVATKFEQLILAGVTNGGLIFKLARYHIADARLRYRKNAFLTNVQGLVFTRGDKIEFAHDVMLVGLAYGRVKELNLVGDDIVSVTLDAPMPMQEGDSYGLVFRSPYQPPGSMTLNYQVVTAPGEQQTVTFVDPITPEDLAPAVGDLATFGLFGLETIPVIVKDIQHQSNLWARITVVDEAPAIHDADQGVIPEHVSQITIPPGWWIPVISSIRADAGVYYRDVDGSWLSRILIIYARFAGMDQVVNQVECQYWLTDNDRAPAMIALANFGEGEISLMGVEVGATYKLRLRYLRKNGSRGPWTEIYSHTVEGKITLPADVTGFEVSQVRDIVQFTWTPVPDLDIAGYVLKYVAVGGNWDDGTVITMAMRGTSEATVKIPAGTWDFMIKARDTSGNYSLNEARITFRVVLFYLTLWDGHSFPLWRGALTNYLLNARTGHLLPLDQDLAAGNDFEVFDNFVVNPYAESDFESEEIDLGELLAGQIFARDYSQLGPGENGTLEPALFIDFREEGGAYQGFMPLTKNAFLGRYCKFRVEAQAADGLRHLDDINLIIDKFY